MLYHPKFAYFKFVIINSGKAGSANIHTTSIPGISAKYRWAYQRHMEYEAPESDSATYTERFQMGALKGKSPSDVLNAEGKSGKDTLREQYKFLKKKAEKFPVNKKLMNAITEAV